MSNNFTEKAENALNNAVSIAENLGHTYIGSEHILLSLSADETSCASYILKKNNITKQKIENAIKEYSGIGAKCSLSSKDTTPKCRKILENSYKYSKKYSSEKIGTEHILFAILDEKESVSLKLLSKIEADINSIRDDLIVFLRNTERNILFAESVPDSSIPNLIKFGKNMTKLAEKGQLEPVIGREKETERVIRILARKTKNNPCLIGEAGVGKTAIVEGLAQKIYEGNVPFSLKGKTIFSLDLTSVVAGAKYRGDFEERIKNIMNEVSKNKSIILFIDEIHTIVGAGSAEGAIDAANILKPELSRGNIQLIGATTLSEYKKYIEKDAALERRFQPILIEEPTKEKTVEILLGLKEKYEFHHNVKIEDSAIVASVNLSERYIQDRFLPDKAIDILDEACALATLKSEKNNCKSYLTTENLQQFSRNKEIAISKQNFDTASTISELEKIYNAELFEEKRTKLRTDNIITTEKDVFDVLYEITGIDISKENGLRPKEDIIHNLSEYVIGQDEAVSVLSDAITRSLVGINSPDKPKGIFLFLGESGVGKTELARAMAKELFNTAESLIRYDMSEYSEQYAVSKFIGSAPGYVGYYDTNSSIEQIRRHPYSVILLDEIEKAHPDVLSLFLQIFDTGVLTDATGRKINFKNTYIILTSNIGADKFRTNEKIGFASSENQTSLRNKLKGHFKEEFLNRIDEIILFSSLSEEKLKKIAHKKINELKDRVEKINLNINFENNVPTYIAKRAKEEGFGAREINRLIIDQIESKIADYISREKAKKEDIINISVIDDKISFFVQNKELTQVI